MEEIYIKYSKIVFNYLISLGNNRETAEELMQETFYAATKNINKFRGESTLKVWLCQIAKNKWRDYIKSIKKEKNISLDDEIENLLVDNSIESIEDDIISKEKIISLYKKIHVLDENMREVIYLRIKAELNFKEIGSVFGKSEEWARVTFYRGKMKLKEALKNEK